jgi:hypothetical protein
VSLGAIWNAIESARLPSSAPRADNDGKYANYSNDAIAFVFAGRRHQISENGQFDKNDLIEKLSKYIEEQARMRFQQQIHQHHKQHVAPQEITGPGFSFIMPPMNKENFIRDSDQAIQFAVQPFDSRYYETSDGEEMTDNFGEDTNSLNEENREELDPVPESKNKILIPPPMHVHESGTTDKILHRAQQKQARTQTPPDVLQKPLQVEFDNTMSLYIVALIAGLSCAFSTGVSPTRNRFEKFTSSQNFFHS